MVLHADEIAFPELYALTKRSVNWLTGSLLRASASLTASMILRAKPRIRTH